MSLNFIEALMDKFAPKDSGNSALKNWTGSQNLIGGNGSLNDSILYKYQEALLEANDSSTNLPNKRSTFESTMIPFHHTLSPNSLVSRVSKLLFPSTLTFQDYKHRVHETNTNKTTLFNKVNHLEVNLWEEVMQEALDFAVNISNHHSYNFGRNQNVNNLTKQHVKTSDMSDTIAVICTSSTPDNMPSMAVECFREDSTTQQTKNCIEPESAIGVLAPSSTQEKNKLLEPVMAVVTLCESSTVPKKKFITDNGTLNQELANRKTKELQKRSKKRRRRQKRNKNKNITQNNCDDQILSLGNTSDTSSVAGKIGCCLMNNTQKKPSMDSAPICNVINITDNAHSVQITLPNVSSFVITIDSADDDSDWDENSDCEWLADSSEFELSGLNVANLPSSKPNSLLLSAPSCQEDSEAFQLNMLLHRVNKEWNDATKDLDKKSRSSTKVAFVPDDELVEILPVEYYDRKGEWEMYAMERFRFKRRIDDLDKIISPCLTKEHREAILKRNIDL